MSFTRGVADGQLIGRAVRAESSAAASGAAAYDSERKARAATGDAQNAEASAQQWRSQAVMLRGKINEYAGAATAGIIVMSELVKIMEQMNPADRDRIRDELVRCSRARILDMDRQAKGTKDFVDIEKSMRNLGPNKSLGIV